ncbi:MAG: ABC transporter permease subunit [Clostridia bacterium]|nr:ABC transporter permease subunit [Clostridia bacterium]
MNNKMSNLLYCEFYKINRKHTLLKLAIAVVVIALAMTALSAVLQSVLSGAVISQGLADYDAQIATLKAEMEMLQSSGSWIDKLIVTNGVAGYKARIAILEYLKSHNVTSGSVMAYSGTNSLGILSFDVFSFTNLCMSMLMNVVIIFLIVACCRTTSGEYASGAMKMQFLRPLNKNKFFTAKWLSVVIVAEVLTLISFFLSLILGLILYGPNALNVAFVAGSVVTVLPPMGALMIILLINMVQVFALTQATMFICSLCNTYGKSIVLCLLFLFFNFGTWVEYVLAVPYVGYLGFLANLDWSSGISVDGTIFKGMSIWGMIPITLLWCALFMWFSYKRFNKKEV